MVALREVAPELEQLIDLLGGLDALGDCAQSEAGGQAQDGVDDRAVLAATVMPSTNDLSILILSTGSSALSWPSDE